MPGSLVHLTGQSLYCAMTPHSSRQIEFYLLEFNGTLFLTGIESGGISPGEVVFPLYTVGGINEAIREAVHAGDRWTQRNAAPSSPSGKVIRAPECEAKLSEELIPF